MDPTAIAVVPRQPRTPVSKPSTLFSFMWQKLKEQIPAIIITTALVIVAAFFMVRSITERQQAELTPLRAQNETLAAQAEENRRQIAATNKLLKDALAQNGAAVFRPESNVEKLNEERLTRLAQVIAERVIPAIPAPKSAAEIEASQNEQVDKVSARLVENIRPALADAIAEQKSATLAVTQAGERRAQQLNVGLLATQAAAQDALKLSRDIAALYADSAKDHGVLIRLFSLPASFVMDAARGDMIGSERAKVQRELADKTAEIEKRLAEIRTLAADSGN